MEDLVTFIAIREADEIAATNARKPVRSRRTPKDYERSTKDVTKSVAQRVAATPETSPIPMPPEQRETIKVQLIVSINTITGSATNISHRLRVDPEAPGFHPARGHPQGNAQPRKKPMPETGVM